MIDTQVKGARELLESLNNVAENLAVEVYIALNAAGTKVRSMMAKEVHKELNVAQKIIRKQTKIHKNRELLEVSVSLISSYRIPLRDFAAKQNKKGMVSAKISKSTGKKDYPDAFIVDKFAKHVFKRKGKDRFPLQKLRGPSPFGVLKYSEERLARVTFASGEEVRKQLARRVRYLELKKAGGLNWQQNTNEIEE